MIFGGIVTLGCVFLLFLDYAYLYVEKKRKMSFYSECVIWGLLYVFFGKALLDNSSAWDNAGIKVDVLTFFFLTREALLARVSHGEINRALTVGIRKHAISSAQKIK